MELKGTVIEPDDHIIAATADNKAHALHSLFARSGCGRSEV